MHRTTPRTKAWRRRVAVAAATSLLGVVAGLAVSTPAFAGQGCVESHFGHACVTASQHLDEAYFDGYVTDVTDDDFVAQVTIYVDGADLGTVTAPATFSKFVFGQADTVQLLLCNHNKWYPPDFCVWSDPIDV